MIFRVWAKDDAIAVYNNWLDYGYTACSHDEYNFHKGLAIAIIKSQLFTIGAPDNVRWELLKLGFTYVGEAEVPQGNLIRLQDVFESTKWPTKWGDGLIAEYLSSDFEFRFKSYVE